LFTVGITVINGGGVNVCSDIKDCATCADSYVYIFSFREHCRWCVDTKTCGGPVSCATVNAIVQRDPFKCPEAAPSEKEMKYSDATGRFLYGLTLAGKAHDVAGCLNNSRPEVKLYKTYEKSCDTSNNTCGALIAISDEKKSIYLAYRGQAIDKQLFLEFLHGLGAQMGAWEKFEAGGGVMTYFFAAFDRLFKRGGIKDDILQLHKTYPKYTIWVTGHSLGASLASMTAVYLANVSKIPPEQLHLVTTGEPRTGNALYAKAVETAIKYRYRIVHKNDIVTNTPASVDPQGLVVTKSMMNRQAHFYRHLVHYDNDMKKGDSYKICDLSEDNGCRNLPGAVDFNDHVTYFGVKMDDYYKNNCKDTF